MKNVGLIIRNRNSSQPSASSEPGTRPLRLARAVARVLEIEALEPRLLLSGVVPFTNKKKASFLDADGDKVTVALKGAKGASFDLTLDGNGTKGADIQSIVIHGGDNTTALSIMVKSSKLKVPSTDELKSPQAFTPGFTEIGSLVSTTSLRGINANSAAIDDVSITGSIGGLAIDLGKVKFYSPYWEVGKIDFGKINITGDAGAITLRGVNYGGAPSPFTNDLTGPITVGGTLGSLDARFSDVLAQVTAGAIGSIRVDDILSNIATTGTATLAGSIGSVIATNLNGSVSANPANSAAGLTSVSLTGNLRGAILAGAGAGNLSVDGQFTGLVEAGSIGNTVINGTLFTGTLHATSGNVGNILVSQSTTGFDGHVVSDLGSVGNLTANFFYQAVVEAQTSIGLITANATSASANGSIVDSTFIAHTGGIAGVAAVDTVYGSLFSAGGAIGDIKVTEGELADTVIRGASVGNITVAQDIIYTGVQATVGGIGNITSLGESIYDSHFTSAGAIGNITTADTITASSFLAAGNIGNISASNLVGDDGYWLYSEYAEVWYPGAAIDTSSFVSTGGAIGNVTAIGNHANDAIYDSTFTALTGIGAVNAIAATEDSGDAIADSDFLVTGTGLTGTVIGPITAKSIDGNGISESTYIHAVSGNIGNVTGLGGDGYGIGNAIIVADAGNVGIVKGVSYSSGDGLNTVLINAGVAGSGAIAGIFGQSLTGDGMYYVGAHAGTGGIGTITGVSTGAGVGGDGIFNSGFAATGSIGDITGQSANGNGIAKSAFVANENIGNILGQGTSFASYNGISKSTFHADFDGNGTGAIGTITGTTAGAQGGGEGGSNGIFDSAFYAGSGIGTVVGAATSLYGGDGILNSTFNASYSNTGVGAIGSITGTSVQGTGINGSWFGANDGIGSVYGAALGGYGEDGINNSTFWGDYDHNGVGGIGDVTGISKAKSGYGGGIVDSDFYAGDTIGNVLGSTTAHGDSAGIDNSDFFANAGPAATAGGVGSIGTVTGTASAADGFGWHQGIEDSYFGAGTGLNGTGTIGNITGTATVDSQTANALATGIWNTTINAGTGLGGTGTIGTVTGTATATAIGTHTESVYVPGYDYGPGYYVYYTVANNATVRGINGSTINAGGLSGTIGAISGNATATAGGAEGGADAVGLKNLSVLAGSLAGGTGTISSIAGSGTALGLGTTVADGIRGISVFDGFVNGILADVTGVASATSIAGDATANGLIGDSLYVGFGTGSGAGLGTVAAVSGTATATAAGNAAATGIGSIALYAGYHDGSIASVTGTATASTSGAAPTIKGTVTATARGIDGSVIDAGFGYSNGTIGNVTGTATATAAGANATADAIGINTTSVLAAAKAGGIVSGDNGYGSIADITGTATATATGYDATALATGINKLTAVAADGDYSQGQIGQVTAAATATATAEDDATAIASGIDASSIYAGTGFHSADSRVEGVSGSASATSNTQGDYNDVSKAYAYGVKATPIGAGTGAASTGSVGAVTGTISATANGGSAYTRAYGFFGPTIKVGSLKGELPYIHEVISAYAKSLYGNAKAYTGGLKGLTVIAGFGPYGVGSIAVNPATGDSIYGKATATALAFGPNGNATAKATGVDTVTADIGSGYKGTGTIGNITGIADATAHTYGYKGDASATATGIGNSNFGAGNASSTSGIDPKAFGGTGVIGNITGTATATATGDKDEANAYAYATGISGTTVSAGNAYASGYTGTGLSFGGTGTIGNVSGTGTATATAKGFAGQAGATASGIEFLGLQAGTAYVGGVSGTAYGGTGTIGTITGTATATGTGVGAGDASAWGIDILSARAGNAGSYYGVAYGNSGTIGNLRGTATAIGSASGKYSTSAAVAIGVTYASLSAGNSFGDSLAQGSKTAKSSVGDVTGTASATATAGKMASASTTGLNGVYIEVGTADADYGTGVAVAAYGKIGNISGTAVGTATANDTFGTANAYATGIEDSIANAATAYGATATGATGIIGTLTGSGKATATAATASATAFGIDPSGVYAGTSVVPDYGYTYDTSIGGAGTIGNVSGYALANATGLSAKGYAAGISELTLTAGSASTALVNDKAIAGTGAIGTITGAAIVNVTGSNSAAAVTGMAYGITDTTVSAGDAADDYGSAKGAAGAIGAVTGTATVTVAGTTTGVDADVGGYASGIDNSLFTAGTAVGSSGPGFYAIAGAGTIGNLNGSATVTVTGTTAGDKADVGGTAYGIDEITIRAGTAAGYVATGAASSIGSLTGAAKATVTGTTKGSSADIGVYYVAGIHDVTARVGAATGAPSAKGSSATGGAATIGALSGTGQASVTGTTSGASSDIGGEYVAGLYNVTLVAGDAYAYTATAGTATIGALTGTASFTVKGTTSGADADVYVDDTFGIRDLSISAGNATGNTGFKGSVATAAAATVGAISGTVNLTIDGATSGKSATVIANEVFGIEDTSLTLANATGFTATAVAATTTVGAVTGSATVGLTGATSGASSVIGLNDSDGGANGLSNFTLTAGNATGYAGKGGAATGGAVNVGALSGTATLSVTGATTGDYADVYAENIYGITGLTLDTGSAVGYVATGGATKLGAISGTATLTLTGTTSGKGADVFADIYGMNKLSINASSAGGAEGGIIPSISFAAGTVAKAGAFAVGAISGTASATVVGTTAADGVTVNANYVHGLDGMKLNVAGALGYKAYGGATTIGAISGTATASATATNAGKATNAAAIDVVGVYGLSIAASNANGSYAKAGVAVNGAATIGAISGSATATAALTAATKAGNTSTADAVGVRGASLFVGNASAYTATTANSAVGAVTGAGTATASVNGVGNSASATAYGVRNVGATVGAISGAKLTAGTGSIGGISGSAIASATGYYATANARGVYSAYVSAGSYSVGSVGAIDGKAVATATGDAAGAKSSANADATGLSSLSVNSGAGYKGAGMIGAVTGYAKAVGSAAAGTADGDAYGTDNVALIAGGFKGSGSIGAIKGSAYASDNDASKGAMARGLDLDAYAVGDIASVGGYALKSTYYGGYGIKNTRIAAGGNITGGVTASAATASAIGATTYGIKNSLFSAGGNIGNVNVAKGEVDTSRILAGFNVGSNLTVDAADTAVAGKNIGSVSIQGRFRASDLIASVDDGGDAAWGQANDVGTGSGSIGSVTIGLPTTPGTAAATAAGHGLEAKSLGAISWGGSAIVSDTDVFASGGNSYGSNVRVRSL